MHLTDRIDFELAKILKNRIYAGLHEDRYAAEEVEATWDNYLGVEKFAEGEYIEGGPDNIHGRTYFAPTYAEVLDWLFDKGIVIHFYPGYTFALNERIAYYYKVFDIQKGYMVLLFEELFEMSSFRLAMKEIITKLIEMKLI